MKEPIFARLVRKRIVMGGFAGGFAEGEQGVGKTAFAFRNLLDIYHFDPETVTWNDIKPYVFFKLDKLINALTRVVKDNEEPYPMLVWDDAGIHGSKYLWNTGDQRIAMDLQCTIDLIRCSCRGMIMTTPNHKSMLAAVRGYRFYLMPIFYGNTKWGRIVKAYRLIGYKDWRRNLGIQQTFSCRMPDGIYEGYEPVRRQYLIEFVRLRSKYKRMRELQRKIGMDKILNSISKIKDDLPEYAQVYKVGLGRMAESADSVNESIGEWADSNDSVQSNNNLGESLGADDT
jgi:hypothetical protein